MTISPPVDVAPVGAHAAGLSPSEAAHAHRPSRAAPDSSFRLAASGPSNSPRPASTPKADPFQKFEAMVLQQFVETMLPDNAQSVYGEGVAGDMWKSMLAEHLAEAMAARGGIGIAKGMLRGHYAAAEKATQPGISDPADQTKVARQERPSAAALVQEMQGNLARSLAAGRLSQADAGNGI